MRNKLIFTFLIGIMIIFPISTNASSVSVDLKCPTVVNQNQTITCEVVVSSDVVVTGLAAKYTLNNLSYVSFSPANGFADYASSANGFAVGNNSGKSETFTIGTITLTANNSGSITIHSLDVSDNADNSYSPSSKTASVRVKSSNNSLGNLSLSSGTLSPTFSADVTSYTATVDASNVTINATKGDEYQSISGTGDKALNYGTNTFEIYVNSEIGTKKVYTLVITRPDNRSKVNTLKTLTLNSGTITFNSNTNKYDLKVNGDVSKIKITSTLTDEKSKYVENFGNREVPLNYGLNTVLVKVEAENGDINTYTLNITRNDDRSKVNTLKTLTLNSGTIAFNSNTNNYDLKVNGDVSKIKITSTLTDEKSKYVENFGNREVPLNYGLNTVLVKVEAENGNINTYTLNITREDDRSDINTLSKLNIENYEIDFKSNVNKYEITVEHNIDKIKITSTLTDKKSKYVENFGNREANLSYGVNTILVKVESEKGNVNTYTIVVTRLIEEDLKKKDATISKIIINDKEITEIKDSYNAEIKEGEILKLDLILTNEKATYEIIGNENLTDGSIVTIKVTSEDGANVKEYNITTKIIKDVVIENDVPTDNNKDIPPANEEKEEDNSGMFPVAIAILIIGTSVLGFGIYKTVKK